MANRKINLETMPQFPKLMAEAEKVEENPLPPTEQELFEVVRFLFENKRQTWTQIDNFFYKQSDNRHVASGTWKNLYNRFKTQPPQISSPGIQNQNPNNQQ